MIKEKSEKITEIILTHQKPRKIVRMEFAYE
jgi:hypothetical protein